LYRHCPVAMYGNLLLFRKMRMKKGLKIWVMAVLTVTSAIPSLMGYSLPKVAITDLPFDKTASALVLDTCRYHDSLQLVALYNATGGANWTNTWNLNQPINTWYGVTLNATGCVSTILLSNNRLIGTIPNFNLPNLQSLGLNNNQLTGNIPNFNLPNLQSLWLYQNQLSGSIPNFNLPNLQNLFLGNNRLTGSIPNFNLPNLQSLYLVESQLTGNIPNFNLPNLQSLYLRENQLTGSIPNFNLPNLEYLSLGGNQLGGTIPNFNLPNLKGFFVRNNQLTGNIPNFNNLANLITLDIASNQLTGAIPNLNLPNLGGLYLQDNRLTGCIPNSLRINCPLIGANGYILNNPNLSTQNWANYWNNGTGACMPTYQDSTTAAQCGSREYAWRGHTFNQAGTYTDTVGATGRDTVYTLVLREDLSCRCQDSIVMASMYHNAGGYPAAWDLRQPFSDWAGLKFNAAGCLEQFTYPVADSVRCVRPHANDTLKADFGFFSYMQLQNHWLKDNNFNRTANTLIINDFQRLDTGRYIAKRNIPNGGFALIPTLRTIYSQAIRLKYCCETTRDTTRRTLVQGNCISWGGMQRCTAGSYSDTLQNAAGCDSIRVLVLQIIPCSVNVQIQAAQNCLTANATSTYPIVQYNWSKSGISMGGTPTICVQTSGLYKVQVRDSVGCTKVDSFQVRITGRFYLDSTRMNCVDNNIYTPILLRQTVRNAEGYTVRINYDPTKIEPDNSNHLYKYLMPRPDSTGIHFNILNGNQLVLTFFPTGTGMMNGNIGDLLINIAWKPVGNVVNNSLTTLSGWVEESIQGLGGQEIYAVTNPIRFTRQPGRILTWFYNTNNGSHQQSSIVNPTKVKVGVPTQMTTLGIVGGGGTFEINPMIGNHIGVSRQSQIGVGLPEIGGLDANLLSLLIAGSSDTRVMQLSVNQLIAADVNGDGSYTAADLAALEQRAIRTQTGFLQNNGALQPNAIQSWRFFPKSRLSLEPTYRINNIRYTDPINVLRYRIPRIDTLFQVDSFYLTRCDSTVTTLEMMSVLLGDINANNAHNNVSKGKSVDEVKLEVPTCPVPFRKIPIYIKSDRLIYGVDAKIENYAANMQIVGFDNVQTGVQLRLNTDNIQKKTYLVAHSESTTAINQQQPLAYLHVEYSTDRVWQSTAFGDMTWYLNGQITQNLAVPSICVGISEPETGMEVNVFPNPTDGRMVVQSNQVLGKIQIFDSIGRLVQTSETQEMEVEFDISMYANGLYIIKVGDKRFKILKQ
jgi:Secretion system C-terminal sorting domain/Leucine Rich repeats (2 copies)